MEIRIEDLTREQLNEWAAKAQGWDRVVFDEPYPFDVPDEWVWDGGRVYVKHYTPATNPAQWAELIGKFITCLHIYHTSEEQVWAAEYGNGEQWCEGPTPAIAICRAVIASVFGGSVEVE